MLSSKYSDLFIFIICLYACFCRYLVDSGWFLKWKMFVKYNTGTLYWPGVVEKNYPGPIDNSSLVQGRGNI